MSGAEVCLIAKGAQDVYITGNFNHDRNISQYSRTTNFASKVTECLWPNPSEPLRNNSLTVLKIPRNGDLLSFMWLEASKFSIGMLITIVFVSLVFSPNILSFVQQLNIIFQFIIVAVLLIPFIYTEYKKEIINKYIKDYIIIPPMIP